jgi:predicted esterase
MVGGEECLVFTAFGVAGAGNSPTLLVFLHGDVTSTPADYMNYYAPRYVRPGVVTLVLLRPGYHDSEGNRSTDGELKNQYDNYTPHNIEAVALAVRALKERYGAKRVILVGHSGGAAYAGVRLGKYPSLANNAILAACNCNIPDFVSHMRFRPWSSSLSPHDFVGSIARTTRVIAVSGANDVRVPPRIPKKYIETLVERGVSAEYREIPNGVHGFRSIGNSSVFSQALESLIDEAAR